MLKKTFVLVLGVFLLAACFVWAGVGSQAAAPVASGGDSDIEVWNGSAVGEKGVNIGNQQKTGEILNSPVKAGSGDNTGYSVWRSMKVFTVNLSRQNVTLTCYLNGVSRKLTNAIIRPGIIVLPGGGFTGLADKEGEPVALAWVAEGYNAFVLRYTVGDPNGMEETINKAVADTEEALELIRQNAGEWFTDPDRIACVGFSAGGTITAAVGTRGRVRPNACILGYPFIQNENSGGRSPDIYADVSNATPPTFIFAARKDPLLPHSISYVTALQKAGVDFEFHIFHEGRHGMSLAKSFTSEGVAQDVNPAFAQWMPMCAAWIRTVWGDFPTGAEWEAGFGEYALRHLGVLNTPVKYLAQHPDLWAAILNIVPYLESGPTNPDVRDRTLSILGPQFPLLTNEVLAEIDAKTKNILNEK